MKEISSFLSHTKLLIVLVVSFLLAMTYVQIQHAQQVARAAELKNQIARAVIPPTAAPKKFNIDGSYVCKYASTSAMIANRKLTMKTKNASGSAYKIFDGDCLFSWEQIKGKSQNGTKSCGFSQFLSMYETASKFGLFKDGASITSLADKGMIDKMLPASQAALLTDVEQMQKRFQTSCVESTTIRESVFRVPTGIIFKEQKK